MPDITSARLNGKRLIITGGATGIGGAIAARCAQEGARMILVDVDDRVHQTADTLGAVSLVADVTDADAADAAIARALALWDGIDGLANVAGISTDGDVVQTTEDDLRRVLEINLIAPFVWSAAAIPHMVAAGAGSVVHIGSIASLRALPHAVGYVMSKTGLLGLSRSIAVDFGRRGVRSNVICPGTIETEMFAGYAERNPDVAQRLVELNFAGRFGAPAEIAACCAYLLSDEAGFVNGSEISIDGGRAAASVAPGTP
jgi:NAD(P)-dependent dehydrogenase (short-subunit alcohol dehydrogenase family)